MECVADQLQRLNSGSVKILSAAVMECVEV